MNFRDFTKVRYSISAFEVDSIFSQLIQETCKRIHDLKIFFSVGPMVREQPTIKCPSCIVIPGNVIPIEQHLSGARFHYDYSVNIGFALKHPNDCIVMQQALYLEEKIRIAFSKGDSLPILIFDSVSGHFNTQVESSPITPVGVLANEVLEFSSGINVVFSVWQSI